MAQQIKKKFIADDAIDGSKIKLEESESIRVVKSGVEVDMLKFDENGKLISEGSEVSFKTEMESHVEGVRSTLDSSIQQEVSDRQGEISRVEGLVSDEETRAIAAEGVLQGNINQEISDRQNEISRMEGLISDEETARISNDALKVDKAGDSMSGTLSLPEMALLDNEQSTGLYMGKGREDWRGLGNHFMDFSNSLYVNSDLGGNFEFDTGIAHVKVKNAPTESDDVIRKQELDSLESTVNTNNSDLSSRIDVLEQDPTTKTYVDSQDSNLQSQIDTEKSRVDAILSASEADKDSFAEIVSLINSVDTQNDEAFASYVLSNDARSTQIEADLTQEISDRQSADSNLQSQIDNLSSSSSSTSGTIQAELDNTQFGAGLEENGSYSPDALTNYISTASSLFDADKKIDAQVKINEDGLAQEVSDRQSEVLRMEGLISDEEARALAAEGVLQGNIDSEESARIAADQVIQDSVNQEVSDRQSEISRMEGLISDEESARISNDALKVDKAGDSMTGTLFLPEMGLLDNEQSTGLYMGKGREDYRGLGNHFMDFSNSLYVNSDLGGNFEFDTGIAHVKVKNAPTEDDDVARKQEIDFVSGVLDLQDQALSARIDVLEADPTTKTYVDSQDSNLQSQIDTEKARVDAILSGSQADKDSFAEIVNLINSVDTENDQAFASYVLSNDARSTQIEADLAQEILDRQADVDQEEARALAAEGVLQGNIDAEESARISADNALSVRLDYLEAIAYNKESFTLTAGQDSITLAQTPKQQSTVMFVGRLALHEGQDYTVSGNVVTFIGDFHPTSGDEIAAEVGDIVKVTYIY